MDQEDVLKMINDCFAKAHEEFDYKSFFKKELQIIQASDTYKGKEQLEISQILEALTQALYQYQTSVVKTALLYLKREGFFNGP